MLEGMSKEWLEQTALPQYLGRCRWFGGKAFTVKMVKLSTLLQVPMEDVKLFLCFMDVSYVDRVSDTYLLPLNFATSLDAEELQKNAPEAIIARLETEEGEGLLYDGLYHHGFRDILFELFTRKQKIAVQGGELVGNAGRMLKRLMGDRQPPFVSHIGKVEQSNTTIFYDTAFFCKFYRRIEEDINPEAEIGKYLTERVRFANTPPFVGAIEYRRNREKPITLGIFQGYVTNQSDGWTYSLNEIKKYVDRVLAHRDELKACPHLSLMYPNPQAAVPPVLHELMGGFYPEMATVLGRRTGELHLALASRSDDPAFAPEQNTFLYQRSVYQSMHSQAKRILSLLKKNAKKLSPEMKLEVEGVLALEQEIIKRTATFMDRKHSSMQIRTHGDYHLGQVLFTGNDFMLIDFEGEPSRSMSERRIKKSPLRDVAGMLHSFQYVAYAVLYQRDYVRVEEIQIVEPWVEAWHRYAGGSFLSGYLETVNQGNIIPKDRDEMESMLSSFILDKMLYVLGYELNNRPSWVIIPLKQIRSMMEET